MKSIKGLIVILVFTIIVTNIVGCNKKNQENKITIEKEVLNYKALYKEELNSLIEKFGKFENQDNGLPVKGVKYAELVNFDKDEIPEMIVIHDMKILVYKIKDGNAKCIYEGNVGSRYGQSDVSYRVGINTNGEKPSLIVYHAEKIWEEERISVVTIENDEVISKELYAKAKEGNDIPIRENLNSYFIENKATTVDEYNSVYNSIVKNAKSIDVCWEEEPATRSNLESFLLSLE